MYIKRFIKSGVPSWCVELWHGHIVLFGPPVSQGRSEEEGAILQKQPGSLQRQSQQINYFVDQLRFFLVPRVCSPSIGWSKQSPQSELEAPAFQVQFRAQWSLTEHNVICSSRRPHNGVRYLCRTGLASIVADRLDIENGSIDADKFSKNQRGQSVKCFKSLSKQTQFERTIEDSHD